jgi:hypothetical protein
MRFEILPGLPPYGPMALSFTKKGASEHREGLVVRFHPKESASWVGNFIGAPTGFTTVLDHPNERDVIVVAQGDACIIDPGHCAVRDRIAADVQSTYSLPSLGMVVLQRSTDFTSIRAYGTGWQSPRISWDGFRNISVSDTRLSGEAYTPVGDEWEPFTLDLLTGSCADGIYEKEMAPAVLVSPGESLHQRLQNRLRCLSMNWRFTLVPWLRTMLAKLALRRSRKRN